MQGRLPAGGQEVHVALLGTQAGVALLAEQEVLCSGVQGLPARRAGPGYVRPYCACRKNLGRQHTNL